MMKLFIVLEKALDAGLKMAQAVHAGFLFDEEYPELRHQWYTESNNIVVLEEEDLPTLADELEKRGYRLSRFTEPDLDDRLTAICVEPAAKKALCKLELAAA
jgi:hypothetical protein